LQQGDLITEFDNHSVRTPDELARRIHAAKPRSKIKMKVYRGTAEQAVELTIGHGW
jgi:S1-C subfamily serine protease